MNNELELGQGERLPWLETAEDYDARRQRGWTMVLAVLAGLAALLLVIGGIWYTQRDRAGSGNGELIAAPATPYKERAPGDDGMTVGTESDAMLAASEGQEARGRIAAPADPAVRARADAQPGTAASDAADDAPTAAAPAATPGSGAAVQLGALNDRATAEAQWTKLVGSQSELKGLAHSVEEVQAGGKTVFRLRAAVADTAAAKALCRSLQSDNVPCFTVR